MDVFNIWPAAPSKQHKNVLKNIGLLLLLLLLL